MTESPAPPRQDTVQTPLRRVKGRIPGPVKAGARGVTRGAGLITSPLRSGPDFLIIGTKRGGTTSLWYALAGHPDVAPLFPALQELKSAHYFDIHYDKGPLWYRSFFATRAALARGSARAGAPMITGEASPYYMFHPLAAERIARDYPGVKLIVSLRDPVERLWSHYNERLAGGTETLDLAAALEAEPARLAGEVDRIIAEQPHYYSFHHDMSSYLARGHYLEQLQPYLGLFPSEQILILRAEDYYADARGELDKVASFLGIRPFPDGPGEEPAHYNRLPRRSLPDAIRAWLVDYYRPHVESVENALGRSFDWPSFIDS